MARINGREIKDVAKERLEKLKPKTSNEAKQIKVRQEAERLPEGFSRRKR